MLIAKRTIVGSVLVIALPLFLWWGDVAGVKFWPAKGMHREQVIKTYGLPDEDKGNSLVFWQGGHTVELELKGQTVEKVRVTQCD